MNSTKKNNEKKKIIIIIALAVVVIALAVLLIFALTKSPGGSDTNPQNTNSDFMIDPNAGDGSVPTESPGKADSIKIPG